jgi:uncharacterized protein (TIGR02284 family)
MTQRHYDIRVLNRLIKLTLDSAENYRKAMADVKSTELTLLFRIRCRERLAVSSQLRDQVNAIGGDPNDYGSVLASLNRALSNLYYAFHHGDKAVVREVDRCENRLKKRYDSVLCKRQLSDRSYRTVQSAYESIESAQQELDKLRRTFGIERH